MIIAILWALTGIVRIIWGLQELQLDFGELPFLYDASEPEWLRLGVPADILLNFLIIALGILAVFTVYGLFTAKSWAYKSALSIPVLTAITDITLTALYVSAPAELELAYYFWLYSVLAVVSLVWIVVIWGYLPRPNVKRYIIATSLPKPIASDAQPSTLPISTLDTKTPEGEVIKTLKTGGHPLTWQEIQMETGLDEKPLNITLRHLFASKKIYKVGKGRAAKYCLTQSLRADYTETTNQRRIELIKWINQWREARELNFSLEHGHFFLEGRHLDDFSKELISHAKCEILVVNPFIQHCDLSNTLIDMRKNGVKVQIFTRPPRDNFPDHLKRKQEYHLKLQNEGISLIYNEKVHAKLIVVDNSVAIVASMNFYPDSSAGVSWETGMISVDAEVVNSIVSSPFSRLA